MRDILFRGKRIDNGEWVEGFYLVRRHRYKGDKNFIDSEPMCNGGYLGYEAIFPDGRLFAVEQGIINWTGKDTPLSTGKGGGE